MKTAFHTLAAFVSFALLLCACGEDEFGEGVRRPPTRIIPRPDPVPLALTEVYFGDDDTAAFAEISNAGTEPVDFDELNAGGDATPEVFLVSNLGERLPLTGTLAPGERRSVEGVEGLLTPSSGELAVRDSRGVVHAYVAWGGDPGARSSILYGEAFAAGLALPAPVQLASPYPVDPTLALVFEDPRGCAAPSAGASSPTVTDCPLGSAALTLTELYFGDADPIDDAPPRPTQLSWVELRNDTGAPLPLLGARLCLGERCAPILESTGALAVDAHAVVLFGVTLEQAQTRALADIGLADETPSGLGCGDAFPCATVALDALSSSFELAVARPGDTGLGAEALLAYLRFGVDAPTVFETDAITAGLWSAGTVGLTTSASTSLQQAAATAVPGPDAWSVAAPSPGAPTVEP